MRIAVTGGTANIGCAITESLLAQGATVAVGQHRSLATSLIEKHGEKLKAVQLDQGSPESCLEFITESVRLLGGLDVLVNIIASLKFNPHYSSKLSIIYKIYEKIQYE